MKPASYADLGDADIPRYRLDGLTAKAIAGNLQIDGVQLLGAQQGGSTDPGYIDLHFATRRGVSIDVPDGYTALVYVYEGRAVVGESNYELKPGNLARLNRKGRLQLDAEAGTRLLVITGKPIGEPIVQHGPFVMNSVEEIQQAIRDYSAGTLV
jgi:redox-sensitive bicupin YhaK (pirin superfamily)